MGITEVITAPRSPWQNAYLERVIGSIPRECLDHIVIFNERHLRRVLSAYVEYLPAYTDASVARQALPGPSSHPTAKQRQGDGHPAIRRAAPSLRTARRLSCSGVRAQSQPPARTRSTHDAAAPKTPTSGIRSLRAHKASPRARSLGS
jgi:hypothetical protein